MWGYQSHFRIFVESSAEELFTSLDPSLRSRLFLLGFRQADNDGGEPVCIDPEDDETLGYDASLFAGVPRIVEDLLAPKPGPGRLISDPLHEQRVIERERRSAWSRAALQVLQREEPDNGWRSFVSQGVPVQDYLVVCVLQLPAAVYDSYPRLEHTEREPVSISPSLLDAVIDEFLFRCSKALQVPEPGSTFQGIDRSKEELLRSAGKHFAAVVPVLLRNLRVGELPYTALTELATSRYEGESNHGRILFARAEHPNVEALVHLQRPVRLSESRGARKLLEIATEGLFALSDGEFIYGFGRMRDGYDPSREDCFQAEFLDGRAWQLSHASAVLMQVRDGVASLPPKPPAEGKLLDVLEREFGSGSDPNLLRELVAAATRQRHGTLLVISDHAADEAERLTAQSTPVTPIKLTPELMKPLTSIDGAVLLDSSGICYSLGVILDGLASARGTPARGARYNSALRYVETVRKQRQHRCVAVVVSEDGPVDVLPDLMPRIARASVEERIRSLEQLAGRSEARVREFYSLMDWFQKHRFYLSAEAAKRINTCRRIIDERLEPRAVGEIRLVFHDLVGNPDLDASYFTD